MEPGKNIDSSVSAQAPPEETWPSPLRAWWGLVVLTLALMVATIDRSIISLLIEPIKADMGLSDTEVSLLIGFAFVFFYAFLGLPIARLADVRSRRGIIGIGIAFWSLATAACGMAGSFWQLFWARVAVGAGEASFAPASYSILTDSFPPEKLPRAMAVNSFGFVAGTGLANLAGGAAIAAVTAIGIITVPLLGDIKPWQMVFLMVGIPGLLVAVLMRTVEEPTRKGMLSGPAEGSHKSGSAPAAPARAMPIADIFRYLRAEYRTYGPIFLSLAVKVLLSFGAALWTPALFIRTWGWTASQIAFAIGVIALIVSPVGIWMGSMLAERFARKGYHDAYMRVVLIATVGILPFSVLFPVVSTPELALTFYGCNLFIASLGVAPGNAALQVITPAEIRGQVRALYQFIFNIVGYAMGPLIVALFTDYLFGADDQLRYSMALLAALLAPIAIIVTWWGLKPYGESYARAMARMGR